MTFEAEAAEKVRVQWEALSEQDRRDLLYGMMAENPPADTELADAYIEYVATVSPDWMAMSFPSAVVLSGLCENRLPWVVADFGSGFSSYVLRRYAARTDALVVSVDDSPEWLQRTETFLALQGLSTEGLVTWEAWVGSRADYPPMELAFHDIASGALRESSMAVIADEMSPGGVLVFDDAQHESHMAAMQSVARSHGWSLACLPETMDGNGRFEAMVVCRASSTL